MSRRSTRRQPAARRSLAVIAALGLAAATAACAGQASAGPAHTRAALVVRVADGQIRGKTAGRTDEYLGIPYAAPPVGQLRWAPPQPPASWPRIRPATAFAPHCPQPAGVFGQASTSEDCLYLNVFAPAVNRGSDLPVMVWIHGGGLVGGESDDYNPSALVANSVIVVTINYRLGALGFLAHPALASRPGGPSGDYGLMDQQAALRWVKRNIRAFGGDPANVTIFGESAGGQSVLMQLASPTARGLFAKAIAESGAYAEYPVPLATAEAQGQAFAAKAGCASQTAECLRSLPVATILADQKQAGASADIDGQVLTEPLKTALASGNFSRVPVIDGSNHDEWRLFVALATFEGHPVTAANYRATIAATLHVSARIAAIIAKQYPLSGYPSPPLAMSAVGTDGIFACPTLLVDQDMAKYTQLYAYEFNDENAPAGYPTPGFPYAATHAAELQYLFGLPSRRTARSRRGSSGWRRRCSKTGRASRNRGRPPTGRGLSLPARRCSRWSRPARGWSRTSPRSTTAACGSLAATSRSALALRDPELLAHRSPDLFDVRALGQRLVHRPAAELRQDVILRDAVGVALAELRPHSLPERGQPHGRQATRALPGQAGGGWPPACCASARRCRWAIRRSCTMRPVPGMITIIAPASADSSSATPSGTSAWAPKMLTSACLRFPRMKTSSRTRTTAEIVSVTQTPPARVRRTLCCTGGGALGSAAPGAGSAEDAAPVTAGIG
jgi:para-nitrobenzyl esterase